MDFWSEQSGVYLFLRALFWLSKVTEGKDGSVIVSKIKECLPSLVLKYKSSKGLEIPANTCDVKDFADFLLNTLGEMVAPVKEEAFYKLQRLDHNGNPIKQESKVAKVESQTCDVCS